MRRLTPEFSLFTFLSDAFVAEDDGEGLTTAAAAAEEDVAEVVVATVDLTTEPKRVLSFCALERGISLGHPPQLSWAQRS